MTTVLFFIVGWGVLFILLLLLPSIFPRKTTAVLALVSGIAAMLIITAEILVSWQMALITGLLLVAVFSFLVSRSVDPLEDTEEEVSELYPDQKKNETVEKRSKTPAPVYAPKESLEDDEKEDSLPDNGSVRRRSDRSMNRFTVEPEEGSDEQETDTSETSRLIIEDEDATLAEKKPLNEDDSEPLKRRDSSIDAETFSQDSEADSLSRKKYKNDNE